MQMLEQDVCTRVFDNVKNLLVCSLLFAAGTDALRGHHQLLLGMAASSVLGGGLIAVSTVLMFLNVSDGIRRLAKLRHHLLLQILLCAAYLIIAERLVEIVWGFRSF
ncbi:hypothetical protein [Silvimonas iriomotensis]|uniref:Uncharacterized protein n=1 Tax=Silvimonas iriomotensis TaxID=449662 RepID=A0ABQ2P6K9_9NEIS|nr:hypothetical protein [Silvimonas iriomotensis]GGP18921.1 hypothetical protein GCM10010970_08050 [Silvimonas iriomotensis]